jgi:hypothetical protein
MTTTQKSAPAPRLKVTVNDVQRELFMSFGLLNELCRGVGSVQSAIQIPTDSELRDYTLLATLSERNENGEVDTPINLRLIDMSLEDAENLLSWASDHCVDFFLRTMERVVKTQEKNLDRFASLKAKSPESSQPSSTGSAT